MNKTHFAQVSMFLRRQNLSALLVCNPGRGAWDHWLGLSEGLPVLPPFHRNTMLLVYADGRIRAVSGLTPHPTDPEQNPLFRAEMLDGALKDNRLGVVNGDFLKAQVWAQIQERFGAVELVELTETLEWMQAFRRPEEVRAMSWAARQYDRLFHTLPMILQPERLERDAVNQIRMRGLQLGADAEDLGLLTQVWLTSGPQGERELCEEVLWPGRRMTWGDRINVQVAGAVPGGVYAAMGRCYIMGRASEDTRREWALALAAEDAAAAMLRPGETLETAVAAAQQLLRQHGARAEAGLWIHGVGVAWQEQPRNIDRSARKKLEENMTLVVRIPVQFGRQAPYCCMDVYQVTPRGGARLSSVSRALTELV